MSIDWITVLAQVANFLVLVWLLKRFLYRPVLDGIDAREAEIARRMEEAVRAREEAEAAQARYASQLEALQRERTSMSDAVRQEAEAQRDTLLAEARERMDQERANWQAYLKEETRAYVARMQAAGARALLALTRKALDDLADETLEERMARHLGSRIESHAGELAQAAGAAGKATVTSHAPLGKGAQEALVRSLHKAFADLPVRFESDPDQAPGVVLHIGGAQLAWTIDTYIDGLEAQLDENLAAGRDLKVLPDED